MMHTPVLLKEVLEIFNPQPGQTYIDMTINGGGHARAIAERVGPTGMVFTNPRDRRTEEYITGRFGKVI